MSEAIEAVLAQLNAEITQRQELVAGLLRLAPAAGLAVLPREPMAKGKTAENRPPRNSEPRRKSGPGISGRPRKTNDSGLDPRTVRCMEKAAGLPEQFTPKELGEATGLANPTACLFRWLELGLVVKHASTGKYERTGKWRKTMGAKPSPTDKAPAPDASQARPIRGCAARTDGKPGGD